MAQPESRNKLDNTPTREALFGGKLVTAQAGFLVGRDNYTEMYNMRYTLGGVGVETRDGTRRFNATAVGSGSTIDKVWQHLYTHAQTRYQDVYCVTQERKLYKADSIPEASNGSGSLGSSLYSFTATSGVPSFCAVENHAICTSGKDLIGYDGATPYVAAFYVADDVTNSALAIAEDDPTIFHILTDEVTDEDTATLATFTLDTLATNNTNALYIGYWQPIDGITFDIGSVNNNAAVLTIKYWDGAGWVDTVNDTGTDSPAGTPFAVDGTITWTSPAVGTESPRKINGFNLFWYRLETDTLLDEVTVLKLTVTKDWRAIEDLTDGDFITCSGFLWMDDGDDDKQDFLENVISESRGSFAKFVDTTADTDIAAGDEVYIGFPIRIMGISVDIVSEYNNDGNASTLTVSWWDGDSWVAYVASDEMTDGTSANSKTFAQSGEIRLEDKGTAVKIHTVGGSKLPMYWYKLTFSAKCYNDENDVMRVWRVRGVPAQRVIKKYNCVLNFKDRLFLFGPEDAPNIADYSSYKLPYALSGFDTSSIQPRITFGDRDDVTTAVNFYNEALVFKRAETWMMEGDGPDTFGTLLLDPALGCIAPETAKVVRTWVSTPEGRKDFRYAVLFQSYDGVYGCDGVKCWKVSGDIQNYFDPTKSEAIKLGYRDLSSAFFDPLRNEYHFFLWSGATPTLYEFVYNSELERWAGPWVRGVNVVCGESVVTSGPELHTYGGGTDGRLYHLESNTYSDVDSSGTNAAINNYVTVADDWQTLQTRWAHRGIYLYGVAQASGAVTVTIFGDDADTGAALGTISMINAGYGNFSGKLTIGDTDSGGSSMENKFQSARLRFSLNTVAVKQELYGYVLTRAPVGFSE